MTLRIDRSLLPLLALPALWSCGDRGKPTQAELEDARGRVEAAVEGAEQVRTALEVLGLLPDYSCGEPRQTFVGKVVGQAQTAIGCATVSTQAESSSSDAVVLDYQAGCTVAGRSLAGRTVVRYAGGESRMQVEADFKDTTVDGKPLLAKAGYGKCGDETRYWGAVEGALPKRPATWAKIDGRVGVREGLPVLGGTTLILDGPGELTHSQGLDRVTLTGLAYEIGEYLPQEGELLVETSSGHRVLARFRATLWRLGEAEVTVDDREPVTVPVIH